MAMDLETPTPAPDPTPAPAEPVAPAVPVAPADPDDAAAVDVGGEKMVPLAALKAARTEAKSLKTEKSQMEAFLLEAAPYIKVLQDNPQLFQQRQAPQAPPAPPTQADPELVELAQSLDYFDKSGQFDLQRAAKHREIVQRQAAKIAQQMVAPLAQQTDQERSNGNWARFAQAKLPNGQPIDPNILGKYWRAVPANITADPRAAMAVFSQAATEQMYNSPLPAQPQAPASPPLHTENVGSVPRRTAAITPVEQMVMAARGMDAKTYDSLTKGFTSGRTSSLED